MIEHVCNVVYQLMELSEILKTVVTFDLKPLCFGSEKFLAFSEGTGDPEGSPLPGRQRQTAACVKLLQTLQFT